jgi:hypothetical protein
VSIITRSQIDLPLIFILANAYPARIAQKVEIITVVDATITEFLR